MRALVLAAVVVLTGCKPVARTALDVARAACDVFFAGQPKDAPVGMSLDDCAEHLLASQKLAASGRTEDKCSAP